MADKQLLEYSIPIESKATINDEFLIEGIAINETTTSNGHTFLEEELKSSAKTLRGVPLLKDHDNSVDSIVGIVQESNFDEINKNIPFKAIVKDSSMKEKIKNGLINSVSVGAHVDPKDIEETEDGNIIPHNITFKELSLVAIPADPSATFTKVLQNAYDLFKSNSSNGDLMTERRKDKMTQEKQITESDTFEKLDKAKLELAETELAIVEKKLAEAKTKLENADADEVEAEAEVEASTEVEAEPEVEKTVEVEEEDEESEEAVEESGKYKITQGYNSFSVERKSYVY